MLVLFFPTVVQNRTKIELDEGIKRSYFFSMRNLPLAAETHKVRTCFLFLRAGLVNWMKMVSEIRFDPDMDAQSMQTPDVHLIVTWGMRLSLCLDDCSLD